MTTPLSSANMTTTPADAVCMEEEVIAVMSSWLDETIDECAGRLVEHAVTWFQMPFPFSFELAGHVADNTHLILPESRDFLTIVDSALRVKPAQITFAVRKKTSAEIIIESLTSQMTDKAKQVAGRAPGHPLLRLDTIKAEDFVRVEGGRPALLKVLAEYCVAHRQHIWLRQCANARMVPHHYQHLPSLHDSTVTELWQSGGAAFRLLLEDHLAWKQGLELLRNYTGGPGRAYVYEKRHVRLLKLPPGADGLVHQITCYTRS
jgi:hypothetical protein